MTAEGPKEREEEGERGKNIRKEVEAEEGT